MTWCFVFHMVIYDYFASVFCIVPKKVLLLKERKWVSHLKNRYHYAKVVENARINFLISLYCTLLFSRKENFKFVVDLSGVLCNGAVGCMMNVWGYQHWNTANTSLRIYLLFENDHKSTQTRCEVCSNSAKCTTTIDFRLTSVFFIKGYLRYKTITSQIVPSEAQIRIFFISQKNFVPFSRYSSFCIFNHHMIYQICDVTVSISTWDKVRFWIYLLNYNSWSHQTWPFDRYQPGQ